MSSKIDEDYEANLVDLFDSMELDPDQMSDWEKGFMSDQKTRYDEYGVNMFLSSKQRGIIARVAEKYGIDFDNG